MAVGCENTSITDCVNSGMITSTGHSLPELTLSPLRNLILIAAMHESRTPCRPGGLYIPETAVEGCSYIGVVVGVGPDAKWTGLEFGDLVIPNKRNYFEDQATQWFNRFRGVGLQTEEYEFVSKDKTRRVRVNGNDRVAAVVPEQLFFTAGKWADYTNASGIPMSLGAGPGRVLARMLDREEYSNSPIMEHNFSVQGKCLAEILSVGADPYGAEVEVGQIMIADPYQGLRYSWPSQPDKWYVALLTRYIQAVYEKADFTGRNVEARIVGKMTR